MVARVSRGQPWDEALSGAAAGVGLALGKEIKMAHLKWAAVVAGYPSVPQEVLVGTVPIGDYPDGLPQRLESFSSPSDDVGIVRLRKGPEDLWVSVRATGCGGFALCCPWECGEGHSLYIRYRPPPAQRSFEVRHRGSIEYIKGNSTTNAVCQGNWGCTDAI